MSWPFYLIIMYLTKTPWWLKAISPNLIWHKSRSEKKVYLTFDDGPTPEITPWVLSLLKTYDAKGTFFLIGKNIKENPALKCQIEEEGHSIGNHTFNHLNAWKTGTDDYLHNVELCQNIMDTKLFRPPYGRIHPKLVKALGKNYKVIMWDVLSGDFDINLSPDKCAKNVLKSVKNGSIIVFHDSVKAWPRLEKALPKILEDLSKANYTFAAL